MEPNNTIEIDINFNENDFRPYAFFITSGYEITSCNFINVLNSWTDPEEYKTNMNGKIFLKHVIQCLKEGINLDEYGTPEKITIWNKSNPKRS